MNKFRLVPEWFPQKGVLMSLPHEHTDWAYMLDQVHECYINILRALVKYDVAPMLLVPSVEYACKVLPDDMIKTIGLVEADYNDTWIRDYGPLTLKNGNDELRLADFGFNGWGLKFAADKDNLVINKLFGPGSSSFPANGYRNFLAYVLEGGSVEVDEYGTLLTTSRCLCSPNRNGGLSKAEVKKILSSALGINHLLWLDYGALSGDDTDSHIDTLARMCPEETILYVGCTPDETEHFEQLSLMKQQLLNMRTPSDKPYNLIELPLPEAIFDPEDGHRLPATYANYLVTDKAVLVPVYGQPKRDELACRIIGIVYHDREIVPIDCNALIRQHGSLHCATMQLNA
ncbi:MAG: agmatine deiminase family protein [Prevotella sp.]|nr:agmatine deiminase family protein [Prevotella sp.]MCM1075517.1 agmatine deiminase family protein [Ruminococcus sp.]